MNWVRAAFFVLWGVFPVMAWTQFDLSAYSFSSADGLPSNTIYDIVQDEQGAIWIGHERGLTRFNGMGFQHFRFPDGEVALSGIVAWGHDSVLARSFRGDAVLVHATGLTVLPQLKRELPSYPRYYRNGGTKMGIQSMEIFLINEAFQPQKFAWSRTFQKMEIFESYLFADSLLYVLGGESVACSKINLKSGEIRLIADLPQNGRGLFFEWKKKICLLTFGSNQIAVLEGNRVLSTTLVELGQEAKITRVTALNDSLVAIGTFQGLFLVDGEGKMVGHYFKDYQISTVLQDREGNLWVSTLHDGVFVVPSLHIQQLQASGFGSRHTKFASSHVIGQDQLMVGTFDGQVLWFDLKGKLLRTTDLGRKVEIQSLALKANGRSLFAFCDGIFEIDIQSGRILSRQAITSTKVIRSIGETLYCGTSRGLIILRQGKLLHDLKNEWISDMEIDNQNNLVILGRSGLYYFNLSDPTATPQLIEQSGTSATRFSQLYRDTKGSVFALSPGRACYRVDSGLMSKVIDLPFADHREITHFVFEDGLFYGASNDRLWVYDGRWHNYGLKDGILERDIRGIELIGKDIFLFSPNAILKLDALPKTSITQPKIYLRGASGNYEWTDGRWIADHGGNRLEVELEALPSVSSRGNLKVEYRLEGQGEQWIPAEVEQNRHRVRLERLPAGDYNLQFRTTNPGGMHMENLTIPLTIRPPFYAKFWFWGLMAILLAGVVYGIVQWRVRLTERKNQAKIAQERLKIQVLSAELKAIRSQMNPHFIFNTLSAIQAKVLAQDGDAAYDDLSTFSKLLRSVLDFSSREYISLEEEIGFLQNYLKLESNRFGDSFQYTVSVDDALEGQWIRIPTLITQPFVENALRHGLLHQNGQKQLTISCTGHPGDLLIRIADNGVGREASAQINAQRPDKHQSFATQAIEQRVSFLRQSGGPVVTLTIQDLNLGTEVNIRIQDE